jgi:hypothetical protein
VSRGHQSRSAGPPVGADRQATPSRHHASFLAGARRPERRQRTLPLSCPVDKASQILVRQRLLIDEGRDPRTCAHRALIPEPHRCRKGEMGRAMRGTWWGERQSAK